MTNKGNKGNQYQCQNPPCCALTISDKFILPETINTPTSANPMGISYEIIWAADLKAPRNAYREFEAQPAIIMPYTPTDVIANKYNNPTLISANTRPTSKGITAHAARAG